jgi:hypothetical protein
MLIRFIISEYLSFENTLWLRGCGCMTVWMYRRMAMQHCTHVYNMYMYVFGMNE